MLTFYTCVAYTIEIYVHIDITKVTLGGTSRRIPRTKPHEFFVK